MSNIEWTLNMNERLTVLVKFRQLSYGDIAKKLSREFNVKLTRNACIGKARRLGFSERKARRIVSKEPVEARKPIDRPPRPWIKKQAKRPALVLGKVTIYKLKDHHCRWPFGERPPFITFCGDTQVEGLPYCAAHCRMAYVTPQRRSSNAIYNQIV
jgi:GcrA cell cycle regulator